MNHNLSVITNLLLSSTLIVRVPSIDAQEGIARILADTTSYCHAKLSPSGEDTRSSLNPLLNEGPGNMIDFYGWCNHDPLGTDEISAQRGLLLRRVYEDGEWFMRVAK